MNHKDSNIIGLIIFLSKEPQTLKANILGIWNLIFLSVNGICAMVHPSLEKASQNI